MARDLRGPGLRAYFCHAAKVGKNALKPRGLRIPELRGSLVCARGTVGLAYRTAVRFVPPYSYLNVLVGDPYRVAGLTHRGAELEVLR